MLPNLNVIYVDMNILYDHDVIFYLRLKDWKNFINKFYFSRNGY
jgi:hypothetical protein